MKRAMRSRGPGGSRAVAFVALLAQRRSVAGAGSPAAGGRCDRSSGSRCEGNQAADRELILRTLSVPLGRPLSVERLREGTAASTTWGCSPPSRSPPSDAPDSGHRLDRPGDGESPDRVARFRRATRRSGRRISRGRSASGPARSSPARKLWESRLRRREGVRGCGVCERALHADGRAAIPEQTALTLRVEEGATGQDREDLDRGQPGLR